MWCNIVNIWHSLILVLKNTEIKITILRQAGQHTKLILMPF